MPQRHGLGKGLDALIPTSPALQQKAAEGGILQLPVDAILRNPRQPRDQFDSRDLEELAASIREHGIIQPLIVAPRTDGNYTLIAGERRLEAAKLAGLRLVPAVSRQASDRDLLELALIENIQRAELNPLEEADAYRQLTEDFGLSHEEVALRVGKSRPAISNTLRLLQLSDNAKKALIESYAHDEGADQDIDKGGESKFRLSEGHARALLRLSTHQAQDAALKTVIAGKLNVRQTEELVKRLDGEKRLSLPKRTISPEVAELEKRLEESLETKVKLRYSKETGGTVTIRYYSDEELNKLLERLL
jgi:ParB family chromosome partitioning protein